MIASVEVALATARLAADLPRWLRSPITLHQAREHVRRGLELREQRFLDLTRHAVFGNHSSPHAVLLRHAGCEPGDLERLVRVDGLEGALGQLRDRGVYITLDELKGRRPIVRGSLRLHASPLDFRNPLFRPHIIMPTGGSGGIPTPIPQSLALNSELAAMDALTWDAHGVVDWPKACWTNNPITRFLISAKLGTPLEHWFHWLDPMPWSVRVGLAMLRMGNRAAGVPFPRVGYLDPAEPEKMVLWLAGRVRQRGRVLIATTPSAAVRVSIAALKSGQRLDGVTFAPRSEATTEARRRNIEASGARVIVDYGSLEVMSVAAGCVNPTAADDCHVYTHRHAVITDRRPVFEGGPEVEALQLTSLSRHASVICLNTELGDHADLRHRDAGCCPLGALGLTTHLSNIRSFEKLTGEGVTVATAGMLRIIEEVLPARFGGSSVDYQLVEVERPDGLTSLIVRAHPSVGPVDEAAVRDLLLGELESGNLVDRNIAQTWRRLGTLTVQRLPPLASPSGKVLPFHTSRS